MADSEIACAGAARQAEMVRAGEVSPTELVRLCLERIERLDPQLNAFRVVLRRAGAAGGRAGRGAAEGGRGATAARRPDRAQGLIDLAGELTTHGTDGFPDPAAADSEMVRRLREAGAIVIGKTLLPELAICGFTESATWGVTRNPWNPQRTPGGSSGGSAAAVAAGLVPIASASDGGRLDSHPRRLLRALRAEATARADLAGPRPRTLERPLGQRLRQPHRARHRAVARRGQRRLAGAGSAAAARAALCRGGTTPPRASSGSPARPPRRGPPRRRPSPTSPRARSPRPPSCCARSATRYASATPTGARSATTRCLATCAAVAEDFETVPHPERLERRTRGFAQARTLDPRQALRTGAASANGPMRPGSTRSSTPTTC